MCTVTVTSLLYSDPPFSLLSGWTFNIQILLKILESYPLFVAVSFKGLGVGAAPVVYTLEHMSGGK